MDLAEYDRLPSRRISVDSGEIFTIDVGSGPTVLLVHGSPLSSLEWRAVIARLMPDFRVLAPDLLSFGRSIGPSRGSGFVEQAEGLRQLIDRIGVDRFHLVVHDWGGPSGLGAAARQPGQVDRLVLQNTTVRPGFRPPLYWRPMSAPVLGEVALLGANAFSLGLPLFLRAARHDRNLWHRYRHPLKRRSSRRTVLRLERLDGYETECERIIQALPQLEGPKLILWGEPDPFLRRELEPLQLLIRDARVVRIQGAGHFVAEDRPVDAAAKIRLFLE
jgi:haloalkane dehalogenase